MHLKEKGTCITGRFKQWKSWFLMLSGSLLCRRIKELRLFAGWVRDITHECLNPCVQIWTLQLWVC